MTHIFANAWRDGWETALARGTIADCPHERGTETHRAWIAGYSFARLANPRAIPTIAPHNAPRREKPPGC